MVDHITLPVNRENTDKQCISHAKPVKGFKWFTESGGPASKDYCLYLFFHAELCGATGEGVNGFRNVTTSVFGEWPDD